MKILLFGASGSAGSAILDYCLASTDVDEVRVIVRRSLQRKANPKLVEYVHDDFSNFRALEFAFSNVDSCLWCLGRSSTQIKTEEEYRFITHDITLAAAHLLKEKSPNAAFHYISGEGTRADSMLMWSRVKAETENDLMALMGAVCWRPAFIDGNPSASETVWVKLFRPVLKLLKPFKGAYVSAADLARAMLITTKANVRSKVLRNVDIRNLIESHQNK